MMDQSFDKEITKIVSLDINKNQDNYEFDIFISSWNTYVKRIFNAVSRITIIISDILVYIKNQED